MSAEPKPEKPRTTPASAAMASAARKRPSAMAEANSEVSGNMVTAARHSAGSLYSRSDKRQRLSCRRASCALGAGLHERYQEFDMARPIRILGIDPGLRRTGWGVVVIEGCRLSFLACGSLATDDTAALAARLVTIHDGLRRVVEEFAPDEAAVEATFVNK